MARVADVPGIKQLIQPLEESGTLIRRTEEEVTLVHFPLLQQLFDHTFNN